MTKSQAIAAIASEIILWQSRQKSAKVYNFDVAKELAEHLLDKGCECEVFMPYEPPNDYDGYQDIYMWEEEKPTEEQRKEMRESAKISPEHREILDKKFGKGVGSD